MYGLSVAVVVVVVVVGATSSILIGRGLVVVSGWVTIADLSMIVDMQFFVPAEIYDEM